YASLVADGDRGQRREVPRRHVIPNRKQILDVRWNRTASGVNLTVAANARVQSIQEVQELAAGLQCVTTTLTERISEVVPERIVEAEIGLREVAGGPNRVTAKIDTR